MAILIKEYKNKTFGRVGHRSKDIQLKKSKYKSLPKGERKALVRWLIIKRKDVFNNDINVDSLVFSYKNTKKWHYNFFKLMLSQLKYSQGESLRLRVEKISVKYKRLYGGN